MEEVLNVKRVGNWIKLCGVLVFSFGLVSCCGKVPTLPSPVVENRYPYEAFVHIKVVPKDNEAVAEGVSPDVYLAMKQYFQATGSGAVIENDGNTQIVTAGHVCDSSDMVFPASPFPEFEIMAYDWLGNGYKAEIKSIDMKNDLCLVEIENVEFPGELDIAKRPPRMKERLFLAAAPLGIFVKGMPLFFDGYYSGEDPNGNVLSTVPVAPGSSGGAIVNKRGEIVSIVTAGFVGFDNVSISTSASVLRQFLEAAEE